MNYAAMKEHTTDILFVTPSYSPSLRQESIGTLIIAKKAQLANYVVKIVRFWEVDMTRYSSFKIELCNHILTFNPKIVSFYCRGAEYHILVDLASYLKTLQPNICIVFGGPQAELVAEDTLAQFADIDFVCCGEGENTIVPLLDFIIKNNQNIDLARLLPGLVYRDKYNNICKNKLPELLPDNYTRNFNYYDLIPMSVISQSKSVTIDVGRGCPFSCTFCSTKTFWKQKYRLRHISDTINEIDYIIKHFGKKLFSFSHDLFTVNKSRIIEFCDKILENNYNIKWTCSSRIDSINHKMIDKMALSGLVAVYFGIETGSPRMQKIINKRLNIEQCVDIVRYSISRGVAATTSFIYGFPEETYEDLEQTLCIMHKMLSIGADVQLHCLSLDKGSVLYEQYHNKQVFVKNDNLESFGFYELAGLIEKHPDIFSTFWDYPSELRQNMKFLHTFHSIGREYPKTYIAVISLLLDKGSKYVDAYRMIFDMINNSIAHFENAHVKISKSMCYFIFVKIISKLTNESYAINLSITEQDITNLKDVLSIENQHLIK